MKNLIMLLMSTVFVSSVLGQDDIEPKIKLQGGIWSGTNGTTSVVGIPAAKLSATFPFGQKAKVETGLTLIPGLVSDAQGARLGLSAGGTVTFRKNSWKLKPILGVVVAKTTTWQVLPGIGFVF